MLTYWQVFSDYFNILSAILGGLKYAFLSAIVCLIIMFIVRRKILVYRPHWSLKYLARSYFFIIPIGVLMIAFAYGCIKSVREQIIDHTSFYQSQVQQVVKQYLDDEMVIEIDINMTPEQLLDQVMPTLKTHIHQQLTEAQLINDKWAQYVLTLLESSLSSSLIKSQVKSQLAKYSGLDQDMVNELFTAKMSDLISGNIVIKVVVYYISVFFNGLMMKILIIGGVLLLLPIGEIIFANRRKCNTQKAAST